MHKQIAALVAAFVLLTSGLAFAGATGGENSGSTTSNTTSNTTSTTTTYGTTDNYINVGNIHLGTYITGSAHNNAWEYTWSWTYSQTANYSSTLELLTQGVGSWSESGNYYGATHPGYEAVSVNGRGSVYNESGLQYMGSNNVALSANSSSTATSYDVTTSTSTSTDTSTSDVTAGDYILGTTTNTNVNTNTNTNTETHYQTTVDHYSGSGSYDYYAVNAEVWISPIVLDLSGSGKLDASNGLWLPHRGVQGKKLALFDIRGNGLDMLMEWVGPTCGLLVEPKADGTVDGTCLFGTPGGFENGFEKLSVRDRNKDGSINGAELQGLAVWIDKNGNAKAEAGEIVSLASLKVTELSVKHSNLKSTFVMNGKSETMWDWFPTALDVRKLPKVAAK